MVFLDKKDFVWPTTEDEFKLLKEDARLFFSKILEELKLVEASDSSYWSISFGRFIDEDEISTLRDFSDRLLSLKWEDVMNCDILNYSLGEVDDIYNSCFSRFLKKNRDLKVENIFIWEELKKLREIIFRWHLLNIMEMSGCKKSINEKFEIDLYNHSCFNNEYIFGKIEEIIKNCYSWEKIKSSIEDMILEEGIVEKYCSTDLSFDNLPEDEKEKITSDIKFSLSKYYFRLAKDKKDKEFIKDLIKTL